MSQSINQTIDEGYTSFTSNASFEHQTLKNPKIQSSKTTEAQLKSLYSISKLIYDNNTARLYKATCRKTNQPVIIKRMLKTKSSPDEITLAIQANQVCPEYTLPVLFVAEDNILHLCAAIFWEKFVWFYGGEERLFVCRRS